jgi:hypothetical protein
MRMFSCISHPVSFIMQAKLSELGHLLLILDFVRACPNSFQADLANITIIQPKLGSPAHTHSFWCASKNEVTGYQRRSFTQESDRLRDAEDLVTR